MNPIETLYYYLAISAAMFMLGVIGVLIRRNAIIVFMCVELMLNAVNLALVAFSNYWNDPAGTMLVFFVMCVAAAEAVVGLAIIIALFRNKETVKLNNVNIFKW
ncbi:MAG: NADH-quinone oxidoreductase subunit NuoK [Bacteroidetes bacterium]|jgi:NADH-quinone oxidoreductase subunit K|nr:NADH-quinone oxidoreductase subunit NuoK [Bacteroidota bacterium]